MKPMAEENKTQPWRVAQQPWESEDFPAWVQKLHMDIDGLDWSLGKMGAPVEWVTKREEVSTDDLEIILFGGFASNVMLPPQL